MPINCYLLRANCFCQLALSSTVFWYILMMQSGNETEKASLDKAQYFCYFFNRSSLLACTQEQTGTVFIAYTTFLLFSHNSQHSLVVFCQNVFHSVID